LLEKKLLLAVASLNENAEIETLLSNYADDIDWFVLVEMAMKHDVSGILCKVLLEISKTVVPEAIMLACQQKLRQQRLINEAAQQQLTELLIKLNTAGIEAVPFKGITLAMSAYGDISLRSFRDLDFLIREEQIEACLSQLRELGYHHEHGLSPKQWQEFVDYAGQDILFGQGLPVEPHWALAPRTLSLDIDYIRLWERVSSTSFNGQTVLTLSPEDELIILCMHGSKHEWSKLKWVVDLSLFIRSHTDIDWDIIMNRAQSQGLSRIVIFGLALTQRLVGSAIPESVIQWMDKDAFALRESAKLAANYFEAAQREERPNSQLHYFRWIIRERYLDRCRYLYRTLTQPTVVHFADITLSDRVFFLYFPYKVLHDYFALPVWLCFKALRQQLRRLPSNS
jgi:hypothetical protein